MNTITLLPKYNNKHKVDMYTTRYNQKDKLTVMAN